MNSTLLKILGSTFCLSTCLFGMETSQETIKEIFKNTLREELKQIIQEEVKNQSCNNSSWFSNFLSFLGPKLLPTVDTILFSITIGGLIVKYRFWASGADIKRADQHSEEKLKEAQKNIQEHDAKNVKEINEKISESTSNVKLQSLRLAEIIQAHDSQNEKVTKSLKSAGTNLRDTENKSIALIKGFAETQTKKSQENQQKLDVLIGNSKQKMTAGEAKMAEMESFYKSLLKNHDEVVGNKFSEISEHLTDQAKKNQEATDEIIIDIKLTKEQFNNLNENIGQLARKLDAGALSSQETLKLLDETLNKNKQTQSEESAIENLQSLVGLMIEGQEKSAEKNDKKRIISSPKKQPQNSVLPKFPEVPSVSFDDKKKGIDGQLLLKNQ